MFALTLLVIGFTALAAKEGPCDIYEAGGTPCVAAHSTVRALYGNYSGPLYTIQRSSDGATKQIGVLEPGGFADTATQDIFCGSYDISYTRKSVNQVCEESARVKTHCGDCGPKWGDLEACENLCNSFQECRYLTFFEDQGCRVYSECKAPIPYSGVGTDTFERQGVVCSILNIFDQSPRGNNLLTGPGGGAAPRHDQPTNAVRGKTIANGHSVYGAYFEGGMGYRLDNTNGIAVDDEPESIYMVASGTHYNDKCCFDYGNAETNNLDDGAGTMEAVYWGSCGGWGHGAGEGPWVMADVENCLSAGSNTTCNAMQPANVPVIADYVVGMVKGTHNRYAIKGGDANTGVLTAMYDGTRPNGYDPMKKQGAIILGIGGDNSNRAVGTFYEGAMTQGFASDAIDQAVHDNIMNFGRYGY